jgi:hypothetical protein
MAIRWENIVLVVALAAGGYFVYKNWDRLFGKKSVFPIEGAAFQGAQQASGPIPGASSSTPVGGGMTSGGGAPVGPSGGGGFESQQAGGGTNEMTRQGQLVSTARQAQPSLRGYSDIKQMVANFLNEKYGDLMAELRIDQLDILHSYSFFRAFQEYALDQLGIGRDKWEQIYSQTSSGRPLGIENYMPISADPRSTYLAYYVTLKAPELKPYFDAHYAPNLEEIRRQAEKVAQWYWETMPSYRERFGGNYEAYKNQLVEHYTNVAKQFGSTSPGLQIVPPGGVAIVYDRVLRRDVCLGDKCPGQGHTKLIEVRDGIPVYEYDPTAAERIRQQKSSQPVQASSISTPSALTGASTPRNLTSFQNVGYSTYPSYGGSYANTRPTSSSPSTSVGSISQPVLITTPSSGISTSYNRVTQSTSFLGTGAQRPQPGFMYSGTGTSAQSISSRSTQTGSAGTPSSFLNTFNQWVKGNVSDADMIKALDAYIKSGR